MRFKKLFPGITKTLDVEFFYHISFGVKLNLGNNVTLKMFTVPNFK